MRHSTQTTLHEYPFRQQIHQNDRLWYSPFNEPFKTLLQNGTVKTILTSFQIWPINCFIIAWFWHWNKGERRSTETQTNPRGNVHMTSTCHCILMPNSQSPLESRSHNASAWYADHSFNNAMFNRDKLCWFEQVQCKVPSRRWCSFYRMWSPKQHKPVAKIFVVSICHVRKVFWHVGRQTVILEAWRMSGRSFVMDGSKRKTESRVNHKFKVVWISALSEWTTLNTTVIHQQSPFGRVEEKYWRQTKRFKPSGSHSSVDRI